MTQSIHRFLRTDSHAFQQLILWIPLATALAGLALLLSMPATTPLYLGVLVAVILFDVVALATPERVQGRLRLAAPTVYGSALLVLWLSAFYLYPSHPATNLILVGCTLHLPTLYVLLFIQSSPARAARASLLVLGAFVLAVLPHALGSLPGRHPFDGLVLPLSMIYASSAQIAVMFGFSGLRERLRDQRAAAQELHELAHRDPLTGLHNRRALEQDLEAASARSPSTANSLPLLSMLDVNGLKRLNDRLGHAAGDDLLRRLGSGLVLALGERGHVYRISGDEFAVLSDRTPGEISRLVSEVTQQVRAVYPDAGASHGCACWTPDESPSLWLSRADHAMYREKKAGR